MSAILIPVIALCIAVLFVYVSVYEFIFMLIFPKHISRTVIDSVDGSVENIIPKPQNPKFSEAKTPAGVNLKAIEFIVIDSGRNTIKIFLYWLYLFMFIYLLLFVIGATIGPLYGMIKLIFF